MTRLEIAGWRQRTIEAEERLYYSGGHQGFTEVDKSDAAGWPGCAVGESYAKAGKKLKLVLSAAALEADFHYEGPKDSVLFRLGNEFSEVVATNNFLRAYEIIDLIEARVLTIRSRARL